MSLKMKPKTFSPEQLDAIKVEAANQTPDVVIPKSTDPENFPVFEIPVNSKVKIYVPNHIVTDEKGIVSLRMDKPLYHTVIDGKRFRKIRCINGLSEAVGYSGECPFCNGESEPWDLANEMIKEQCKVRGLDPNDSENEAVKTVKREYYSKRVIKAPEQYYTFPIVVLETNPDNIKELVVDENGMPKHKTYWYTISKSAYEKKWLKTLEGLEDEPTHPGGYTFILNYTYESKSGDYNKRDSARELQVVSCKIKGFDQVAPILDKETEEWDPIKAMQTIYDNMYYDEEDLKAEADRLLAPTREKLAIYASIGSESVDTGFQLGTQVTGKSLPVGDDDDMSALPMAGQVDED